MKFTLRDLFWLVLVIALVCSHVNLCMKRTNEYIVCPCCSSMYELDEWTRELRGVEP